VIKGRGVTSPLMHILMMLEGTYIELGLGSPRNLYDVGFLRDPCDYYPNFP